VVRCGVRAVVITPTDVEKNSPISMKATGILNKPTSSGKYNLNVKYAGATLYSHEGNICGDETVGVDAGYEVSHQGGD
jgi:hypothetical protein